MKETLKAYIRLVRADNLLFIALLLWLMEALVARPVLSTAGLSEQLPWWLFALITLATVCIAAGGYVINDWFDVKIDRINRPDTLIVTRLVDKESAMRLFIGLTATGVVTGMTSAAVCHSWSLAATYLVVPGLLWFYSASYKRQLIIGNLIIAFAAALTPLVIALADTGYLHRQYGDMLYCTDVPALLYTRIGIFAIFAFLCTWIREVVKDLQDQAGDRELECHTLPIVYGERVTRVIVTVLIILTAALLAGFICEFTPYSLAVRSAIMRYTAAVLIPFGCELALLWSATRPEDYRNAQRLMKFIMFLGMLYAITLV